MSALSGQSLGRVVLSVPTYGAWRADVTLTNGAAPAEGAAVELEVGDLTLVGTVLRSGLDAPGKPRAVVVGGAGWDRVLAAPLSYQSSAGVRLSTVLKDLAALAGETIVQPSDRDIGDHFEAPAGMRLRDVLAVMRSDGYLPAWRVDADGVTRFGARSGTAVTGRATQLRANAAVGLAVYGTETPGQYLPGNQVDGATIERAVVVETSGKLVVEVWTKTTNAMARIVLAAAPGLAFTYPRSYRVVAVNADKTLDLEALTDDPALPPLRAVEQWSLGGALVTPALGSEVLVLFRDANPTRPVMVACARAAAELVDFPLGSTAPADPVNLAPDGRVVRYGDSIMFSAPGPGVVAPGVPGTPVAKVSA